MLEFRNVSYSVAGKDILKNINLTIDDRFVAITGPNGSGKSTMAKLIAGIIKPTEGSILMDGVEKHLLILMMFMLKQVFQLMT